MLRVCIVGKENGVRNYLHNLIEWRNYGCEIIFETSDGEVAYPNILRLRPDIIIAEYNMPYMSGISMCRLLKKELFDTEIILVTDSKKLEEAVACFKVGASDYISNNISAKELVEILRNMGERISHKRNRLDVERKYIDAAKKNVLMERYKLFSDIVTASAPVEELIDRANAIGIDLAASWYGLLIINVKDRYEAGEYDRDFNEPKEPDNIISFDLGLEGKAYIFKADTEEECNVRLYNFIDRIKSFFESNDSVGYYGGIGNVAKRLSKMPDMYEEAVMGYIRSCLSGKKQILGGRMDAACEYACTDILPDMGSCDIKCLDRDKVTEFLKIGELEEVDSFVSDMISSIGNEVLSISVVRRYYVVDIYIIVCLFLENLHLQKDEIDSPEAHVEADEPIESSVKYIAKIMKKAMQLREFASQSRYEEVVGEAVRYIEQLYADEKLSLSILASHVNFSPNHLSMIFRQQTGKTFIKYLTNYRMNKAKELLRYTTKRSSEISVEVGYKDPHYFSYLFKKTQGMTPTQYRGHL